MYEQFYEFNEKPFSLLPDPDFLYLGEQHSSALTSLEYGMLNRAGFTVVTGEIGSGKTTLVRHLLNHLDDDVTVGLISNTHRSFGELLEWVLLAFGLEYRNKHKAELYETLIEFLISEYAQARRTVLIVDEAQNMDADTLENLRLISNINADKDEILQMVLVGQPGLRETLRGPALEQFASRINVDYHINPLTADETARYIQHRIEVAGGTTRLFGPQACESVYRHTSGIPRLINVVCDTALVYGFGARRKRISASLVDEVVHDKLKGGLFGRRANGASDSPLSASRSSASTVPLEPTATGPQGHAGAVSDNQESGVDSELFRELFADLRRND